MMEGAASCSQGFDFDARQSRVDSAALNDGCFDRGAPRDLCFLWHDDADALDPGRLAGGCDRVLELDVALRAPLETSRRIRPSAAAFPQAVGRTPVGDDRRRPEVTDAGAPHPCAGP